MGELISDVLLWTPTYGWAKAGRQAWTYIQQLCEDMGCNPEDLPEAMNYREKWRERVRDICASGTTWWWPIWYYDRLLLPMILWIKFSHLCISSLCSVFYWPIKMAILCWTYRRLVIYLFSLSSFIIKISSSCWRFSNLVSYFLLIFCFLELGMFSLDLFWIDTFQLLMSNVCFLFSLKSLQFSFFFLWIIMISNKMGILPSCRHVNTTV